MSLKQSKNPIIKFELSKRTDIDYECLFREVNTIFNSTKTWDSITNLIKDALEKVKAINTPAMVDWVCIFCNEVNECNITETILKKRTSIKCKNCERGSDPKAVIDPNLFSIVSNYFGGLTEYVKDNSVCDGPS
ncbi:MAG: hypothetical protein ACOC1K_04275 [Nanoarchaeota archaeon]